jgi:xanthine dehydrogenase accessory factor
MRDVLDPLTELWSAGGPVALATVVGTYSSAPRQAGASMLVAADGRVVGSVSGGCVEGAVYELGRQVLVDGEPVLQRYGVSDDDAFTVGLTCGGIIDIFVERIDTGSFPRLADLARAISAGEPLAVATVVAGPPDRVGRRIVLRAGRTEGGTGSARLDDVIANDACGLLDAGRNGLLHYGRDGRRRGEGLDVFVESFAPPPRLIVFGAIDFAAAMA